MPIASVERLGDERVAESEGGRAESVGRRGGNGRVVSEIKSATFEAQSKHLHHPLAENERQEFVVGYVLHLGAHNFARLCKFV